MRADLPVNRKVYDGRMTSERTRTALAVAIVLMPVPVGLLLVLIEMLRGGR